MLDFKEVTLEAKSMVDSYFESSGQMGCEYTFANLFIWRKLNRVRITEYKGFLLTKYTFKGKCFYAIPTGKGDLKAAVEALYEDSKSCGSDFKLYGLSNESVALLNEVMPDTFDFKKSRDWYDYIYEAGDLINLTGKKYSPKRNHINKFESINGPDCYEDLTEANIEECMDAYRKWAAGQEGTDLSHEYEALTEALTNFVPLGLKGGLIRSKLTGHVCAFTAGSAINKDVFVIHIEKGLHECPGVYAVINRDFAKHNLSDYKYINREEDMGLPGLRKAKLSYHPAILLEKSIATFRK